VLNIVTSLAITGVSGGARVFDGLSCGGRDFRFERGAGLWAWGPIIRECCWLKGGSEEHSQDCLCHNSDGGKIEKGDAVW
jgi:hypothetical protein